MKIPSVEWWDQDHNFWDTVWVSEEFRRLSGHDSWLSRHVIPLLKTKQIGFFTPPEGSRFYFSAWLMNSVMCREYDNKIIQDLYVLHEALHAATIDNYFAATDNPFFALRVNEIEVSLETEAWFYVRNPDLIGRTFSPLWVVQEKIFDNEKKSQEIALSSGVFEKEYRDLSQTVPWVIPREDTAFLNSRVSEPSMWWSRRQSTFLPESLSDMMVKQYDDLSVKWIGKIKHRIADVNIGRSILLNDRDSFMRYLEKHEVNGLPFGDLNPAFKKKGVLS